MNYNEVFDRLWTNYKNQNPSIEKIFNLFANEGEQVKNDHIAFRTFNDSRLNINVLSRIFIQNGYVEKGEYFFKEKHLIARHFEHADDANAPRVFISELILDEFSQDIKEVINKYINSIPQNVLKSDDLIFTGALIDRPSYNTYIKLLKESEYAAWVYVFGFRANHFTISINALKKYNSIELVNEFLKSNGIILNSTGGEIKGSKEELLRQSSTIADLVKIQFCEGIYEIPSCYYEFAERHSDSTGKLFSGFIAKSADKIFESTNFYRK